MHNDFERRRPSRWAVPLFTMVVVLMLCSPGQALPRRVLVSFGPADQEAIRSAIPARASAKPLRTRRILVFYRTEGFVHACIPFANEAFRLLGEKTGAYGADFSDSLDTLSASNLAHYDALVLNNTTRLSLPPESRTAILNFVSGGKGLVGIHAAVDSFYDWPEGQELLGALFHSHPWTAGDTVAVKIDDPDSPITAAFSRQGFWVKDEIYQMTGPYSRTREHVLVSMDMSKPMNARKPEALVRGDNDFPIAWVKKQGRGRVFYTSLGHNPEMYRTRQVLQHYLDGIQFALGDLRVDTTPTANLKRAPMPALAPESSAIVIDETNELNH